ncbi:hypothetical protein SB861_50725 [Paraburkholderia sp. SIMBA_049]
MPADDDRFVENNIPVKAIATSNAQNDSGVFELGFRDERYLPFEGAGAISEWSMELLNDDSSDFGKALRQFDYGTISDAILHVKYTAREDTGQFKSGAIAHLRDYFSRDGAINSLRMFNLRQEFPTEWYRFLNPTNPAVGNVFELEMALGLFPVRDLNKTLKVNTIWLLARCTGTGNYTVAMTLPSPALPPDGSDTIALNADDKFGGLQFKKTRCRRKGYSACSNRPTGQMASKNDPPGRWNLQQDPVKKIMEVEDMILVLGYEWE